MDSARIADSIRKLKLDDVFCALYVAAKFRDHAIPDKFITLGNHLAGTYTLPVKPKVTSFQLCRKCRSVINQGQGYHLIWQACPKCSPIAITDVYASKICNVWFIDPPAQSILPCGE